MHIPSVSLSQLESHLWEAANILRGPVDAADFKPYVFPLLFFKRLSDVHGEEFRTALKQYDGDEESARLFPENYGFQMPAHSHWREVRKINRDVGRALQAATDEHLQRVVCAYQDFKDEPGFTCVVPIEEIRAKEGNLSISLYVGGETQVQTDAATETATATLADTLAGWLESSSVLRDTLDSLFVTGKEAGEIKSC